MEINPATLDEIQAARQRIAPYVRKTPTVRSKTLSKRLGTNLYLKQELFQLTGSFKVRGAFNKALLASPDERRRGLVAVSGGNHAQAVAYVGATLGVRSLIFMPESTPANYLDATREYGAEVVLKPAVAEAFQEMERCASEGMAGIHPFDDPKVMAGQGTLGLEILDDVPEVTDIIVSIGGGGLMAGVATAVKSTRPEVRIWGVETVGSDAMAQALAAGHVVQMAKLTSIAKTLGAPAVSPTTLALAQQYLESVTVVPDAEAVAALRLLLERTKLLTEPAASCTLAAAERLRANFSPSSHVVLILCGGNLSIDDLCRFHAGF